MVVYLRTKSQEIRKIILDFPSGKDPVLVSGTGINPITSSSVGSEFIP
jgi:hypothetical protein